MNSESFLIEENDFEYAREISKLIEVPLVRERATANAIAAKIAEKYFNDIEVDISSGLHKNSIILENLEISDIYIKNSYIDVRIYFEENELCVPKSHFKKGIQPLAYMFIKLNDDLSGGIVTGFLPSDAVNENQCQGEYYYITENDLVSFYDIEALLIESPDIELPQNFQKSIYDYLDGRLEDADELYLILTKSREARKIFADIAKAKAIFNFVARTANSAQENTITESAPTDENNFTVINEELEEEISLDLDKNESIIELSEEQEECALGEYTIDTDPLENFDEVEDLEVSVQEESFTHFEEQAEDQLDTELEEPIEIESFGEPNSITDIENVEDSSIIDNYLKDDLILEEANSEISKPTETQEDFIELPESEDHKSLESNNTAAMSENIKANELEENIEEDAEDLSGFMELETDVVEVEVAEVGSYDYATTTTPSIDYIEEALTEEDLDMEPEPVEQGAQASDEFHPEDETLEAIYPNQEEISGDDLIHQQKKRTSIIPLLGVLTLIGAIGYYSYTKFAIQTNIPEASPQTAVKENSQVVDKPEAMPIETVENIKPAERTEEAAPVSIPAIEQNLDASIAISNLTVNWEVPAGYASNNTAKRYFLKLGKVIQLELKTELLLLSKQPITDRITLELEFNKNTQKFNIKELTTSSGEIVVDNVIKQTVAKVLDMNFSMNLSSFNTIVGNPVLVIKL